MPAVKDVLHRSNPNTPASLLHEHIGESDLDWPTGSVRRECNTGDEPHKWKHNKWVWRSKGKVQHDGQLAEVRQCLGVLRCGNCQRLTRPKTQEASRKQQIKDGCTERTCRIDAPLIHESCDARTLHYKMDRNGRSVSVWEHHGDHSTHAKPPGGALSKFEEDQVDLQVMRRHDATAHELRTGDAGPGSIPLPEISPILAAPSSARYQLTQSQSRLDLTKRLPTPFIIDSSLSGPVYMTFQTPFMDSILHEAVETWILDFADGPEASRHGIVVDGDHTFFRQGPLLASCVFSRVSAEWTPILYSWINGLDKAHHRPHFAHLFKSIIKHAGDRFTRKLLLCVMDFSGAQRGAHAEEYADAVISTMPHFSQLSPEAQDAERRALIREVEEAETSRTFNEVVSTYTKALTIYSAIPPPSPGLTLVNTPPASPAAPAEEINPGPLVMFLFNGMPPDAAQFPELPPPSEWCGGCRQIAVAADPIMDLEHVDEFCCPACLSSLDNGQALWSDEFAYYPARVAGITSTGMVRVEWYKDNIYEQTDEPAETDFVCSKHECADTAAQEPEGKYDRTNVGAIKWPPRLVDDAYQLYDYRNPKISRALSDAHKSVVAIIKAADFTMHPILSDYDAWMAEAPQAKEVKHAEAFIRKFSSAAILAGDASLYESHIAEVIAECLPRTQEVSESVRLRASILSSTLFQLVILRVYLVRSARDDIQIYFLARRFSPGEYIAADDPLAAAKGSIVIRHLTIPETVLQVPETSASLESMPREFCKIRTFIRKAAAARISPGFCLATAYSSDKQEYDWSLTGSSAGLNGVELPPIAFLPQDSPTNRSSPLSDLPPSDVELDLGSDNKAPGGRKREREEDCARARAPGERQNPPLVG
ncbi:hypothetical protein B0H14DRAFT_3456690 [Mycena olivaceomarginata]|nr:hypothetical protein B0H14DRAFT_3456690 [Mycena olivaceomarginata]